MGFMWGFFYCFFFLQQFDNLAQAKTLMEEISAYISASATQSVPG